MTEQDMGNVSDGYHTFNELYEHRSMLFVLVMNLLDTHSWYAHKQQDGQEYEGYILCGINLPSVGQITYHLKEKYTRYLENIKCLDVAPAWDGHTPQDVISRIDEYILYELLATSVSHDEP